MRKAEKSSNDDETVHFGLRMPRWLLRKVDIFLEELRKENPGAILNRSDAVRTLVIKALDEENT